MKICFVSAGSFPIPPIHGGAIEAHILNLATHLSREGHKAIILDRQYKGIRVPTHPLVSRLRVPYVRWKVKEGMLAGMFNELLFGVWSSFFLFRMRRDIGVIHVHTVLAGMILFFTSKLIGRPLVYTSHNTMWTVDHVGFATRLFQIIEKFIILGSTRTIAVSESLRSHIITKARVPSSKIVTITNGVDTEFFKPGLDATAVLRSLNLEDSRIILYVGRLISAKGADVLIRAIPYVLAESRDARRLRFVVVGPRSEAFDPRMKNSFAFQLESLVQELGVQQHVRLTGALPLDDLRRLYSASHLFILPSRAEAQPLVLLEAMSSGVPMIGSTAGGIPETIRDGETGLIMRTHRPKELAGLILRLLAENIHNVLARRARSEALAKYDWEIIVRKVLRIYEASVLKQN